MKAQRREILDRLQDHLTESDIVAAALAGITCQRVYRPGNPYPVRLGMVTRVSLGLVLTLPDSKGVSLDTEGSLLLARATCRWRLRMENTGLFPPDLLFETTRES